MEETHLCQTCKAKNRCQQTGGSDANALLHLLLQFHIIPDAHLFAWANKSKLADLGALAAEVEQLHREIVDICPYLRTNPA